MIEINERQVRLGARPANKREAIAQVGQLLVDSGNIAADYVTSMQRREEVANTYLGNAIAIPHGLPEDRELIHRTGVAVLQVPAGVEWNPDETAQFIVGIAAKSDEHIEVLRRLTRVLGDAEQVARLTQTTNPHDVIEALTGERPPTVASVTPLSDYDHFFDAVIRGATGLHARPAAMFVGLARRFQSNIKVRYGNRVADAKSLISLLQLGAEHGANIRVSAQGTDAEAALTTLREGIEQGLGDKTEVQEKPQTAPVTGTQYNWTPQSVRATIMGVSASSGIAIGPVHHYAHQTIVVEDQRSDPLVEGDRFQSALSAAQTELNRLAEEVAVRSGASNAAILQVHSEFLNDAGLIQQTVSLIFAGHSAAWAWQHAIGERVNALRQLQDPILSGRAADLDDVGQRVLRHMSNTNASNGNVTGTITQPAILIAADLAPSDTATLDPRMVLGFCTVGGGPTSHTAIIARSLAIPALVGAGEEVMHVAEGTLCILDGSTGKLYVQPSEADVRQAKALQQQTVQQQDVAQSKRFAPATTTDGHRVEVVANIGNVEDARKAADAGAEGVGLLRTEFLFLSRNSAPSEEEQFTVYRDIVQALNNQPVIIRTLDIGGDKEVSYLNLPKEENPFLGVRGVRLCMAHPELFIPQLRAIYRAAAYGPIKIMFPMIATLEDWEKARDVAEQVRQEVNGPDVPLGIMVEVPSAVVLADHLAQEVAFFSIGTNDLTQYTLAMDRGHPQLAKQADGLHPAVLRLIAQTVQAATKAGKWVGVCGGVASEPLGATILTGLGVTELSVSVPSVADIKAHIRSASLEEMQRIAQKALLCRTAAEVRSL